MTNKQFEQLSKAEKRVAIAKDVLKLIKAEKLIPETGSYVENDQLDSILWNNDEVDIKKALKELQQPCEVCALGAIFYAETIKRNDCVIVGRFVRRDDITKRMKDIFTKGQMIMIESAFESGDFNELRIVSQGNIELSINFGSQYTEPKERLVAIMENIVKNKGTFKP